MVSQIPRHMRVPSSMICTNSIFCVGHRLTTAEDYGTEHRCIHPLRQPEYWNTMLSTSGIRINLL